MTKLVDLLQPRDYLSAGRTLSVLTMVAAAVTVVFVGVDPNGPSTVEIWLTVGIGTLAGVAGWRVFRPRSVHPVYWALAPVLAVALIIALDFLTGDASVSAQVFLFFPVLYAASQLKRPAVVIVTAAAVVGEVAVTFTMLPLRQAIVDSGYATAVLLTTAGLLLNAAERSDTLMAQLRQAAAVDSLTGLVTRRVLDRAAQTALAVEANPSGTALIIVDVDKFKLINDGYGHPAGDEVLKQLAGLITRMCRPTDVISRLGGDEIALLLVGCTPATMAIRAEQLLAAVREFPFRLDAHQTVNLTVSLGVAHAPTDADSLASLYKKADLALYQAKRLGRNQAAGAGI